MEFISLHKCVNTSKNGLILTEPLLNTSRGPWTLKRTRKILFIQVGPKKMKEREEERKWDGTCNPWGSSVGQKEASFSYGKRRQYQLEAGRTE